MNLLAGSLPLRQNERPAGRLRYDKRRSRSARIRDLMQPLRAEEPQCIRFDERVELFDSSVPVEWVDKVFAVMGLAPQHTFIVSTVFPERMRAYLTHPNTVMNIGLAALQMVCDELASNPKSKLGEGIVLKASDTDSGAFAEWPLRNVWLGVPVRRQADADAGIPHLLRTPAAVRFVSCEPLLGPVNLRQACELHRWWGADGVECCGVTRNLDWVIAGGDEGRDAQPAHPDWVRSLRDQCAAANVPFWFTGWGEYVPAAVEDDPSFVGGRAFDDPVSGGRGSPMVRLRGRNGTMRGGTERLLEPGERTKGCVMLDRDTIAVRLGRGRTCRLLDGVEHNGYPERA